MKKRIILSSTAVVLFALMAVTIAFLALDKVVEVDQTKKQLQIYNEFFIEDLNWEEQNLDKYMINGFKVRFTVVNRDGDVLFDTKGDVDTNHSDRKEIKDAFEKGTGYTNRFSETANDNLLYFATKVNEEIVVRSAVPIQNIHILTDSKAIYYLTLVITIAILSLILSIKLVKVIIYPIKELENVTSKIKDGDLNKRAVVYNHDEIGSLAENFNKMAEQLQIKINDTLANQNKIEAILESMENGVLAVDNNGVVILINSYVKKIFDIKEEVIGERLSNHILDFEVLEFSRDIEDKEYQEITIYHPKEKHLRMRKASIINENNNIIGVVISISDITDIKRLENMRSQFVANVTHELKTPLTSIKGFSETLRYVEDNATREKFLNIIDNEANRLTRLINGILVLSDLENRNNMKEEMFSPGEVINDTIEILKLEAEKKNINIEFKNLYKNQINGERDKFNQIVMNLIDNAIKYSEEGKKIDVCLEEGKNKLILKVKDNGMGIPKEDLPRIFERFYRVDKSRATKGTGLGLAIVKHIVKLFDGEIDVKSELGVGTEFTIEF